ncbi:YgjV family protein [Hoeflea sp.]|uniref:YgjV family protein n=1 Tax=Hoeflea sp. TaxID=1940281 RepID=UPI003B02DE05
MLTASYILAQILGTIAFGFQVFSARAKERRRLTFFLGVSNIFWTAHYIALGYPLAAIIATLIAVQLIVSSLLDQKHRRPIIVVFIGLYWIAAFITFEHSLHLLPAIGSSVLSLSFLLGRTVTQLLPVVGTSVLSLSLLSGDSAIIVRIGTIVSFSLWMAHGFVTGSVVEIGANGIPLTVAIYGLLFYDLQIRKPPWLRFGQSPIADSKEEE